MKIDPNAPAYPHTYEIEETDEFITHQGMSIRIWLTGQALSGLFGNGCIGSIEDRAGAAVKAADAAIAALNATEKPCSAD